MGWFLKDVAATLCAECVCHLASVRLNFLDVVLPQGDFKIIVGHSDHVCWRHPARAGAGFAVTKQIEYNITCGLVGDCATIARAGNINSVRHRSLCCGILAGGDPKIEGVPKLTLWNMRY